jgi:hypothetical protein
MTAARRWVGVAAGDPRDGCAAGVLPWATVSTTPVRAAAAGAARGGHAGGADPGGGMGVDQPATTMPMHSRHPKAAIPCWTSLPVRRWWCCATRPCRRGRTLHEAEVSGHFHPQAQDRQRARPAGLPASLRRQGQRSPGGGRMILPAFGTLHRRHGRRRPGDPGRRCSPPAPSTRCYWRQRPVCHCLSRSGARRREMTRAPELPWAGAGFFALFVP